MALEMLPRVCSGDGEGYGPLCREFCGPCRACPFSPGAPLCPDAPLGAHNLPQILTGLLGGTPRHSLCRLHSCPFSAATLNVQHPLQGQNATLMMSQSDALTEQAPRNLQPSLEIHGRFLRQRDPRGGKWFPNLTEPKNHPGSSF